MKHFQWGSYILGILKKILIIWFHLISSLFQNIFKSLKLPHKSIFFQLQKIWSALFNYVTIGDTWVLFCLIWSIFSEDKSLKYLSLQKEILYYDCTLVNIFWDVFLLLAGVYIQILLIKFTIRWICSIAYKSVVTVSGMQHRNRGLVFCKLK